MFCTTDDIYKVTSGRIERVSTAVDMLPGIFPRTRFAPGYCESAPVCVSIVSDRGSQVTAVTAWVGAVFGSSAASQREGTDAGPAYRLCVQQKAWSRREKLR